MSRGCRRIARSPVSARDRGRGGGGCVCGGVWGVVCVCGGGVWPGIVQDRHEQLRHAADTLANDCVCMKAA
jgi:hypothetical protein